jgi:hypothetical protein
MIVQFNLISDRVGKILSGLSVENTDSLLGHLSNVRYTLAFIGALV